MNDIEKINVAPDSYFQHIVKPCLLDLRNRKDDAKTDMERGYYEDRYAAQAKDFAEALHISAEALDELIGVLQTKVNRKNEKSSAKFTRPKKGITKQAGEELHRQPG